MDLIIALFVLAFVVVLALKFIIKSLEFMWEHAFTILALVLLFTLVISL